MRADEIVRQPAQGRRHARRSARRPAWTRRGRAV